MIVWIRWVRLPNICVVIKADGYAYPDCKVYDPDSCAMNGIIASYVSATGESKPFEDPVETETPESPHTVAPPTCHVGESEGFSTSSARSTSSDSTAPLSLDHPLTHSTPVLDPSLRRTARMAMRVSPAMSPGLSGSIVEVTPMSDLTFRKRFKSSYDSSPSLIFPVRKRSRGTSELILDTDSEEDEEVDESSDSDSESEDTEDEGPTARDEGGDEAIPRGQQQAAPVMETVVGEPLRLGYEALRRREIASRESKMPSVFKVGHGFGSVPEPERPEGVTTCLETISPSPSIAPSPISSPIISLTVPSLVASLATAEVEGFLAELGSQVEMQGGLIHDHTVRLGELSPALFERYDRDIGELFTRPGVAKDEIFSKRYKFRSLEHEQERTVVTFGALWRHVLALEAWAGRVDTRMTDMSRAEYNDHRLVHDMLLQQAALQRELQEMRGRVTALEQERDRRER
nr:hypothetical protein [Tanacetum cinerariifolium]